MRFDLAGARLYASVGRVSREPARNDMLSGEDNASVPYDLSAVEPERVVDYEAGVELAAPGSRGRANVYAMEFRDEIALTGELSEIGLPLRRNVGSSHRRGLELDALVAAVRARGAWRATASLSRNRIDDWTQYYDVYDEAGAWVGQRAARPRGRAAAAQPAVDRERRRRVEPAARPRR